MLSMHARCSAISRGLRGIALRVAATRRSGPAGASEVASIGNRLPPDVWLTSLRIAPGEIALEAAARAWKPWRQRCVRSRDRPMSWKRGSSTCMTMPSHGGFAYALALDRRRDATDSSVRAPHTVWRRWPHSPARFSRWGCRASPGRPVRSERTPPGPRSDDARAAVAQRAASGAKLERLRSDLGPRPWIRDATARSATFVRDAAQIALHHGTHVASIVAAARIERLTPQSGATAAGPRETAYDVTLEGRYVDVLATLRAFAQLRPPAAIS